jgi:hypothetical protein
MLQRELAKVDGGTLVIVAIGRTKEMCEGIREFCYEIAKKKRAEVRFLDEMLSW